MKQPEQQFFHSILLLSDVSGDNIHSFHMCAYLVPPQEGMSPTTYQHVLISIQHAPYWAASSVKGYIYQAKPETHNTAPPDQDSSFW